MTWFPSILTKDEENICILCLKSKYQRDARKTLILHNLRLVKYIVEKYDHTQISTEELLSEGNYGLVQAASTFSVEKKTSFATYAYRCIENAIMQKYRDITKLEEIEVLMGDEQLGKIIEYEDRLFETVERRLQREHIKEAYDDLTDEEKQLMRIRFWGEESLSERSQKVAAKELGVSQSYVSRMEKNMLYKIKKHLIYGTIDTTKLS